SGIVDPGAGVVRTAPHGNFRSAALFEEDVAPGPNRDGAVERTDLALVVDESAHEDHVTVGRGDRAEVGHSGGGGPVEARRTAVDEVVVVDVEGRDDRVAADVDDTAGTDDDAVGVDHEGVVDGLEHRVDLGDVAGDD